MKKHNFNAGPSILADEVIQNAAKAIVDFNGSGLSLLSISHRTKDFENVMAEADALFRELLGIPDNYKIFYIGGGASTFFYEVPANFLGRKAGYVNTGVWAKKAIKEAKRYGEVELLASSEAISPTSPRVSRSRPIWTMCISPPTIRSTAPSTTKTSLRPCP